jgi:hypothetical protein
VNDLLTVRYELPTRGADHDRRFVPHPRRREGADFTSHTLDETEINRTDYLVHLDSLIAFLEVYEQQGQASGNVVNLVPRQQG